MTSGHVAAVLVWCAWIATVWTVFGLLAYMAWNETQLAQSYALAAVSFLFAAAHTYRAAKVFKDL